MGTYVHFTDEQKYRANHVDLVDFLQRQGEQLVRSGRDMRLKSDHSITVRGNEWFDHADNSGGYAIGFVRRFYNLDFPEAVTMLLGGEQGEDYIVAPKNQQKPSGPFILPSAYTDMRRVYAYLVKSRFIDREVVRFFAKEKLIYESCEKSPDSAREYHNAVFVGLDENGVPRHAHKRGIYTACGGFKGNVEGSHPAYSFHITGESDRLYVFEAPIDMLSFMTLYPTGWQQHSFVSLCGVGEQAMFKMLELHPQLSHVVLCLDHDKAGIETSEKFGVLLAERGIQCGRMLPEYKDWNEDIRALHGMTSIPAEDHPQHIIRDLICDGLSWSEDENGGTAEEMSVILKAVRTHFHEGRLAEAEKCLKEMLADALASAVRAYRLTGDYRNFTTVYSELRDSFKACENRGKFESRIDMLENSMMSVSAIEQWVGVQEKKKLGKGYEAIAAHCLKASVLLEIHQQKQEQQISGLKLV